MQIVQVQTGRVGVEFEHRAVLGGGTHDRVEIDVVGGAAVDQPAGRVGDAIDVGVLDGTQDSIGDLVAGLFLTVMNAGQNPIRHGQTIVR